MKARTTVAVISALQPNYQPEPDKNRRVDILEGGVLSCEGQFCGKDHLHGGLKIILHQLIKIF